MTRGRDGVVKYGLMVDGVDELGAQSSNLVAQVGMLRQSRTGTGTGAAADFSDIFGRAQGARSGVGQGAHLIVGEEVCLW